METYVPRMVLLRETFVIRRLDGRPVTVNRLNLEGLRMLMDWQLRQLGIDPLSVTQACWQVDGEVIGD